MRERKKDSPDEDEPDFDAFDGRKKIERWRLHVLSEAGYPFAIAQRLAMTFDADIHVACEMLKQGCPPETAAEILL